MTDPSGDDAVTDSGGTMRRLTGPPTDAVPDLSVLESLRRSAYDVPLGPAGREPFFEPGQVITWHYGMSADVVRVVRDDARGLVAWLPSESEQIASVPVDGRSIRDRPMAERFTAPRRFVVKQWQGPGILRVAPAGVPWAFWYFFDDDGRFEGHYLNLELVHERPLDGGPRLHTRDLILDLWLEDDETWLKDADELDAAAGAGWCSAQQADTIRDIAEQARREQIDPRAWPLDEGWEAWRPPAEWDAPLRLPEEAVDVVSKTEGPIRRPGETDT